MALDLNVQPPAWLTRASEEAGDPMRNIKQAQAGAALSETLLQAQSMQQELLTKAQQNRDKALDMQELPQWLRDHPTYDSRQNTPWPTPRTPWGQQIIENWRNQDTTSDIRAQKMEEARERARIKLQQEIENNRLITEHVKEFKSRVDILSKGDKALAAPFIGKLSQVPTQKDWDDLAAAEATLGERQTAEQTKREGARKAEAEQARKDGAKVETKINQKTGETEYIITYPGAKSGSSDADTKELLSRRAAIEKHMDRTQTALSGEKLPEKIKALRADLIESINIRNQIDKEIESKQAKSSKSTPTENPDDPAGLGSYRNSDDSDRQKRKKDVEGWIQNMPNIIDPNAPKKKISELIDNMPYVIHPNAPKPTTEELITLMKNASTDQQSPGVYR